MKSTLSDLDMSVRLGAFVMANFLMYAWTRYVVAPARVGWPRLLLSTFLTPLIFLVCILFDQDKNDEFTAAAYCLCNFLWLTPLKIYSFCMNRGQLVKAYDCGSNAAFAVGLLLPVAVAFDAKPVPKEAEDEAKKRHAYRDARFAVVRYKEGARKEALLQFTYAILEVRPPFSFSLPHLCLCDAVRVHGLPQIRPQSSCRCWADVLERFLYWMVCLWLYDVCRSNRQSLYPVHRQHETGTQFQ